MYLVGTLPPSHSDELGLYGETIFPFKTKMGKSITKLLKSLETKGGPP